MPELKCPRCGGTQILVARDMKSTRRCGACHHEWLPAADAVPGTQAARHLAAAIRDGQAVMTMGFSDVDPVITCLTGGHCGLTFKGDAAVDAWRTWYGHLASAHPGWGE